MDSGERPRLEAGRITRIAPGKLDRLPSALDQVKMRKRQIHLDADVLDLPEGSVNSFARGGLSGTDLYQASS